MIAQNNNVLLVFFYRLVEVHSYIGTDACANKLTKTNETDERMHMASKKNVFVTPCRD